MPSSHRPGDASLTQCRAAARAARRAQFGRRALRTARPPGPFDVPRSRGPLAVALYVAGREGRLIWRSPELFALLEPDLGGSRPPLVAGGAAATLARVVDRHWPHLVLIAPAATALTAALAIAAFSRSAAIVLALLAILWVTGLMAVAITLSVGRAAIRAFRSGRGQTVGSLAGWHWSVPLLHAQDPACVPDLLDEVLRQRDRLVAADVDATGRASGVTTTGTGVGAPLIVAVSGVTTAGAGDAVRNAGSDPQPAGIGPDVVVLLPAVRPVVPVAPDESRPGGFALLFVSASALAIAVGAWGVADIEAAACAPACEGRPASFGAALRWLSQRLLLSDPPGLSPGTAQGVVLGLLVSVLALVGIAVLVTAGWRQVRAYRAGVRAYLAGVRQATTRPRVLLLTVTRVEHDAVLAAARSLSGSEPRRVFAGADTLFHLGVLGGVDLVEGQCLQQGPLGPGGSTLTASRLIEQYAPNFVIMVGICFGLRDSDTQRLGDVLVARHIHNVDHRKVVDGPGGVPTDQSRGETAAASPLLVDRCHSARATWTGADVHSGLILSAATLVNSYTYREQLRARFPEAIGGEMEGAGLYAAAAAASVPWALVKAIADLGKDKTREYQEQAAANAAEFVLHVVAAGGLSS